MYAKWKRPLQYNPAYRVPIKAMLRLLIIKKKLTYEFKYMHIIKKKLVSCLKKIHFYGKKKQEKNC